MATRLLVVPKSIPTIISSFCKLPVAILIPIFAILSCDLAANVTQETASGF